jgi:ubiquinone/menaquinone biosynthesis C-methylase UbiE
VSTSSFDRAAGFYDATRGLPDDVRDALASTLAAELKDRGTCLEIGVGTGRIALPLHSLGIQLVGVDVAPAMLERLIINAGGQRPFPIMLADATRLPLQGRSVGTILASHVFHLLSNWRAAIDEAARVLQLGGALYVDFGGDVPAPWNDPVKDIMHRLGVSHVRPGTSSPDDLADYLGDSTHVRPLPPVVMTTQRTLAQDLDEWEHQVHAWTWPYSAATMREVCTEVRAWAASDGWPLERPVQLERTIQWWVFQPGDRQLGQTAQ